MDEKLPLLAHGEEYIESVSKRTGWGEKAYPYTFETAKARILSDMDELLSDIKENAGMYMTEKVICIRMAPKFEAKSYVPVPLIEASAGEARIIGGRKYAIDDSRSDARKAKLYYCRSNDSGLKQIFSEMQSGRRDRQDKWRHTLQSIFSINLMAPEEKVMGFPDGWEDGSVEFVLHPLGITDTEDAIRRFLKISGLDADRVSIKTYEEGLTFVGCRATCKQIEAVSGFNPLRSVHPVWEYDEQVLRSMPIEGPEPAQDKSKPKIVVGAFDSGIDVANPYFQGFADNIDLAENEIRNYRHGNSVAGALLYGSIVEQKGEYLQHPPVYVKMFRVFPEDEKNITSPEGKLGLYETIDHIEETVTNFPEIHLYNLSIGPHMPILDDEINRFTYVLDRLTYQSGEYGENILFAAACGNDGQEDENRIQPPSDMVNGLGVGAHTYNALDEPCYAKYSCVGPGREGAKIKPDVLAFGGDVGRPFISVDLAHGHIGQFIGTSYSAPFALHIIGEMLAATKGLSPHMARTLLIHNARPASTNHGLYTKEEGYGYVLLDAEQMLSCTDTRVTILYEGELAPAMTAKLPVFAPGINNIRGNVTITWTITTIVNPNIFDVDAYTGSAIEDSFYPHSQKYTFHKGKETKKLNLLDEGAITEVKRLIDAGYSQAGMPDTKSPKTYKDEDELRNQDLKWDTVVKKTITMRGSSLYAPFIAVHAMNRDGTTDENIRYFMAVTIDVPRYQGSLYDEILRTYPKLERIKVRTESRVRV